MPGSPVLTIISSVTSGLVWASAGIETSVARKIAIVAIDVLNGASLLFLLLFAIFTQASAFWTGGIERPVAFIAAAPDKTAPDNPAAARSDGAGTRGANALRFEIPRAPRFP